VPEAPSGSPRETSLADLRRNDGATIALVAGEAVTELPKDLYIPPAALEVFLETFEGPLDLLLYLIRRQNLDILDVSVSEITEQYMGYIDLMNELQLELVGEYLVMAAMLAEIKSRMLLPRPESVVDDEDDPRAELIRRLQQYERFKTAAENIATSRLHVQSALSWCGKKPTRMLICGSCWWRWGRCCARPTCFKNMPCKWNP